MFNFNFFCDKNKGRADWTILISLMAIVLLGVFILFSQLGKTPQIRPVPSPLGTEEQPVFLPASEEKIKKFASEEEFKNYLKQSAAERFDWRFTDTVNRLLMPAAEPETAERGGGPGMPERISETTVQVEGIDEPDIVKTDGREIYFSRPYVPPIYREWESDERKIMPPHRKTGDTLLIKAFPPANLNIDASIDYSGNLLLTKNNLVIFPDFSYGAYYDSQENIIKGYDITSPSSPVLNWQIKLDKRSSLVTARLHKNKIYLITRTSVDESRPCPIKPMEVNGSPLTIECRDIYHSVRPVPTDATFMVSILDPGTGKIEKTTSFVASAVSSVVYMSPNAVYITYTYNESFIKFFLAFLKEKGEGLYPVEIIEKLKKIDGYDISESAKIIEFQTIIDKFVNSLNDDERLRIQNELNNRLSDYYKKHKRELEKTGIVKIGNDSLDLLATGTVSGRPLNQFALDEYQGNLRIAVTIGSGWGWGWRFAVIGRAESANDVYVLDSGLKILGSAKDMGITERIYSVRFLEDKGYVVTFREIDPFYVLDLSDPKNPDIKGELKIPGFSSYLHPITKDKILGIGQENWQVKISLFDVSSPEKPIEKAKYILDEGWSEVLGNHRAFLMDQKHQIFFLPGGRGGYIFSYKNDELKLVKAISGLAQVRRAIYLNDYLYVIADDKITVINEIDWEKVREFGLKLQSSPTASPTPIPTILPTSVPVPDWSIPLPW